jgi:hypothetical protein
MAEGKTDNDLVYWNYIDVTIPLKKINPKLFLRETISPRLQNEFRDMNVVLLRSELGYEVNDLATLSFGYDWFRIFNSDSNYENRIWQQVLLQKNNFFTRVRLDERFVEDRDLVLRFRTMFGYRYPLTETLSLELSDEMLFNLNDSAGFEQNRVMLALNKKIDDNMNIIVGYQLQHFFMDRDLINHGIVTRFQVDF